MTDVVIDRTNSGISLPLVRVRLNLEGGGRSVRVEVLVSMNGQEWGVAQRTTLNLPEWSKGRI